MVFLLITSGITVSRIAAAAQNRSTAVAVAAVRAPIADMALISLTLIVILALLPGAVWMPAT